MSERKEIVAPICVKKQENIRNADALVGNSRQQIFLRVAPKTVLMPHGYVVLDYGKELQGSVRILTGGIVDKDNEMREATLRLRFGESLTEACAETGDRCAGNHHSMRDFRCRATTHQIQSYGETGFRFLRIDNESDCAVPVHSVCAINRYFTAERFGTFDCSDELVRSIFQTAKYTLDLTIQNGVIWDGIKRDRCVWSGDLYVQVLTSLYLYGDVKEVRNAIDFCREATPDGEWINAIPSYSVWWMWLVSEYTKYTGDRQYALKHKDYVKKILNDLSVVISEDGVWSAKRHANKFYTANESFFDWPTNGTVDSVYGVKALAYLSVQDVKKLYCDDRDVADICEELCERLKRNNETDCSFKQVVAARMLADMESDENALKKLLDGGAKGVSSFTSYFVLSAIASRGANRQAFSIMKDFYGGMLQAGATSFWEDFDVEWTKNSSRIDEFPKEGQNDIHGDFGRFCYEGFRHSLCHGWSVGAIPYLYERVLGVRAIEPTRKKIVLSPDLCGMSYAEGSFATPFGFVKVRCEAKENGEIETTYVAPKEVTVIVEKNG